MRRSVEFSSLFLLIGLLCTSVCCTHPLLKPGASPDTLTILHWNDFHAQNATFKVSNPNDRSDKYSVGGSAELAGYVTAVRATNKHLLILSAGDEFQGTPISQFTCGKSQIQILNQIMPDAMTVGNHEFDYGADSLRYALSLAKFPVLCANVWDSTTNKTFALPYITRTIAGVKTGIIGVTASGLVHLTLAKNRAGLRLLNTDSVITAAVSDLKKTEKPDIFILLAHEGLDDDSVIAAKHPELSVIIAGHDHRTVRHPYKINGVIIAEAGSRGQYMGELDLAVDKDADKVTGFDGELHELKEGLVPPDPEVTKTIAGFESLVNVRLGEVIGQATVALKKEARGEFESNLGNVECDAFLQTPGHPADIAFVNGSGLRRAIDSGDVKLRDVWEVNPFGNTLVTFTVTGAQFRQMMEVQAGKHSLQVAGMKYSFNSGKPEGSRLVSVDVAGKPVADEKNYTIITNNYIGEHFSDYFGTKPPALTITDTDIIDRDMVIEYIKEHKVISTQVEGRIRAVNQ